MILKPSKILAWTLFQIRRRFSPRYKKNEVTLFRYTKALGDNLMLTTVAHEIRKRNPKAKIHVITGLPEIFDRNPDVDQVSLEPSIPTPGIGKHLVHYEHRFPWTKHILRYCAECVDIFDEIDLKTYIYPSEADRKWAEEKIQFFGGQKPILINRVAGPRTDKKNWPKTYWEQLVNRLLADQVVFDVGGAVEEEPLNFSSDHWASLLGGTTIHQLAALMEKSKLLIAPVSGPIHLAAATGLPVITIVGGSEPLVGTRYPKHHSIVNRPPCKNCYEKGPCEFDFKCLWAIPPDEVYQHVCKILKSDQ